MLPRRPLGVMQIAMFVACACLSTAAGAAQAQPNGRRCAPVYWRTGRDGDQRCPSSHSIIADLSYADLHWTDWTSSEANAHGDDLQFDDAPGPRPGSVVQALTIKLSRVRRCSDGRRIYTRFSGTFYATQRIIGLNARIPLMPTTGPIKSHFHRSYSCNPRPGGIG
jgi:hypothetical protein